MELIITTIGMLLAFIAGAWVSHKSRVNETPIPNIIQNIVDDLPAPISPHEEEGKQRRVKL